jgi:hypothetical protein
MYRLSLLFMFLLLVGCSRPGPQVAPVTGRVTLNGQPLKNADVLFQPEDNQPPAYGRTDEDGRYEMAYKRGVGGAAVGWNRVGISVSRELVRNAPKLAPLEDPRREVKSGQNVFDFDVTTAQK